MNDSLLQTRYGSKSLMEAAAHILEVLSQFIRVNTFFVALNDEVSNSIVKAFNRDESIIQEGMSLPFVQTYCSLVVNHGAPLIIENTQTDSMTQSMPITKDLGSSSFIGVPIILKDGRRCGTICAMNRERFRFNKNEISLLEAMASFLSYVIDLENKAFIDSLTLVYNRTYLQEYYNEAMLAKKSSLAILFVDIDNFKEINDNNGHDVGDELLKQATQTINKFKGKSDVLARLGGDEFLMLLCDYPDRLAVEIIANNIQQEFTKPFEINHNKMRITTSIGISFYPENGENLNTLIKNADKAMYEVKKAGKNSVAVYQNL